LPAEIWLNTIAVMDVRKEVREFLATNPVFRGLLPTDFADDFPLVESGALDSIGLFNLVNFLERKFGVTVESQDLNETYFGTLITIEAFVRSRQQ
jgi:acyl carrier protein